VVADAASPLGDVADLLSRTKLTRIQLVDGSVSRPVGVVHVKDVFAALREVAPPATARPGAVVPSEHPPGGVSPARGAQ
ncbi:MAG: CBS domain-containing protein, partial [Chloroflexota bacterium]